jgi:hypothetical protein
MKSRIVSALIGIAIGLPICAYAEEVRPEPETYSLNSTYSFIMPESNDGEKADEEIRQADLQLLACLVEAEAGNQDFTGKRLVADVVLNRVADPDFPDTIPGVIYQPGQFSPVTNGALAEAYYTVSEESRRAVEAELTDQIDYTIRFFCSGGYGCGVPEYRYGDHYFSR